MMDGLVCRNEKGRQETALSGAAGSDQLTAGDCLRDMAGITIGVPVSNPLRACDRYQAACVSLKADLGNSALTAIISSFVAEQFAASVLMTSCLMVCFGSAVGFSGFVVFLACLGLPPRNPPVAPAILDSDAPAFC